MRIHVAPRRDVTPAGSRRALTRETGIASAADDTATAAPTVTASTGAMRSWARVADGVVRVHARIRWYLGDLRNRWRQWWALVALGARAVRSGLFDDRSRHDLVRGAWGVPPVGP